MSKGLDARGDAALVERAMGALVGKQGPRLAPQVAEVLKLAREAIPAHGRRRPVVTGINISVTEVDGDGNGGPAPTTSFSARTPVNAGPGKRTPIRTGGGHCWTVKIGPLTVIVCVEWEN